MKKKAVKFIPFRLIMSMIIALFNGCTETKQQILPDNSIDLMRFDNSAPLLENPDRGLRMETYITLGTPIYSYPLNAEDPFERAQNMIDKYKTDSPTLCQVYVYLSNYTDRELDSLAFEQLEKYFNLFRNNNVRMLLRFAYQTESVDDAPYEIVSVHIEQLKEWFAENESLINDTLYCMQTGIVGYWGEGHSYNHFKKKDIKKAVADVCDLTPDGIYNQVRTYDMLKLVSDENIEHVGIHDDYIIGDLSHKWAFIPKGHFIKYNKTIEHAKHTVNDGEMPWGSQMLDDKENGAALNELDGKAVLQQLYTYSLTSFSLEHNYRESDGELYSMAKWKEQYLSLNEARELGITVNPNLFKDSSGNDIEMSIYDIIRYHLGYQLVLSNYTETSQTVQFSVTNYGFAAPLNFNYFALVCRDKATGEFVETEIESYDKNTLQSGESISFRVNLPDNCEAAGVKLETFKGRNVCVRFANSTEFKDGVQYFK